MGKKHTQEEKRKILKSKRTTKREYSWLQAENHPMYRRKHSPESIIKIKLARARQIMTPESNIKRSKTLKGRTFSKESLEKMRQHALKRFSKKENHPHFGKERSQEHSKNISKALKGKTLLDLHSPEKAEEIRAKIKKARSKQIFPLEDSSIEVKIQNFLKQLGIEFFTHQHMNIKHSYRCDIFIPYMNLVIECDGDYWHSYPTGKEIDHVRTEELLQKGFKVLRLWEFEIKDMNLKEFQERLK